MKLSALATGAGIALLLTSVGISAAESANYASVRISDVPHIRQKPDFCGEACASMFLGKLGYSVSQDDIFNQSGLDPVVARGCVTRDLVKALERTGFDAGQVWFTANAEQPDPDLEKLFGQLHADLRKGIPSIVCMYYDDSEETTEHFRLVLGYDAETDEILYHEPAERNGAYRRMSRDQMLKLWPLKYDDDEWTVIRFRLKTRGTIRKPRSTEKFTDADYVQHLIQLKAKLPEGFTFVIQRPFIVIGDESPEDVRSWATGTIRWSISRLRSAYFPDAPDRILDIWLFKDKESYEKHVPEVFNDIPHTPFGYYSRLHNALIMNIDTGGGTLVHEIVHPFMATNFPECPSWFNEGLASLYEQSGDNRGRIWGYTNWRLKGLQDTIRANREKKRKEAEAAAAEAAAAEAAAAESANERGAGPNEEAPPENGEGDSTEESNEPATPEIEIPELPSFKELCNTTTREFYYQDAGSNYAQARYLCYYLQQRGLLRRFYQEFRQNARHDPGGYATLKSVLGIRDEEQMARFQESWESWVLRLRYPS